MTSTPRTDAEVVELSAEKYSDLDAYMRMTKHARQLEAELAAERALADRLADALENSVSWDYAKPAFDAWKEARHGIV